MKLKGIFRSIAVLALFFSSGAEAKELIVTQLKTNYLNDLFSPGHLESEQRANAAIDVLSKAYTQLGCIPSNRSVPGQHQGILVMVGADCPSEVLQVLKTEARTLDRKFARSRLTLQMDPWTRREAYRINRNAEIGLSQTDLSKVVLKYDDGQTDGPLFTLEVLKALF